MKCPEARRQVYAVLDNELDVARNLDVLGHLDQCPECARRFECTKAFEELVRDKEPASPPPAGLADRVFARIAQEAAPLAPGAPAPGPGTTPTPVFFLPPAGSPAQLPRPVRRLAHLAAAALLVALTLALSATGRRTERTESAYPPYRGDRAEALVATAVEHTERIGTGAAPLLVSGGDERQIHAALSRKVEYEICNHHDLRAAGFVADGGCVCALPRAIRTPDAAVMRYRRAGVPLTHLVVPSTGIPLNPELLLSGTMIYSYRWRGHDVFITPCGSELCVFVFRVDSGLRDVVFGCLAH